MKWNAERSSLKSRVKEITQQNKDCLALIKSMQDRHNEELTSKRSFLHVNWC
jgi:hypothetical protein